MSLALVPCFLGEANAFVLAHHRHHKPTVGGIFAIAAAVADKIVGVAIVGRPVIGEAGGGSWSCASRPRVDKHPTQTKMRWEMTR